MMGSGLQFPFFRRNLNAFSCRRAPLLFNDTFPRFLCCSFFLEQIGKDPWLSL